MLANCAVYSYPVAPVLIQTHLDWSLFCAPGVSFSNPHIRCCFVHINDVLPRPDTFRQINRELLNSLYCAYLSCLLISIADAPVPNAVIVIELDQCFVTHFQSCLLVQKFHSILD